MNAIRKPNGILARSLSLTLAALLCGSTLSIGLVSSSGHSPAQPLQFQLIPADPRGAPVPERTAIPVIYDQFDREFPSSRPPAPRQAVESRPIPSPVKKTTVAKPSGHSVRGTASWYCKAGVSICHHSYPPGSMVAAACGKLRAVMGSHWRGKVVTVTSGSRRVTVKLVDWCGSTSKLIDLYWEPMRRLGGTGTLPVVVRW